MDAAERIRRWIDGELDAAECAALLADAERDATLAAELDRARALQRDLMALRDDTRAPSGAESSDQLRRIMQRAVERRREYDESPWRHVRALWSPRFRLSVGGLVLASTGVVIATMLLMSSTRTPTSRLPIDAAAQLDTVAERGQPARVEPLETPEIAQTADALDAPGVPVRFLLAAAGARSVSLVGDFNEWRTEAMQLDDSDGDGVFAGTLLLPRGSYGYMFVIDGTRWTVDPHATNFRDDGFGQRNAVIRVN